MEKWLKYLLGIIVVVLFIGVFVASNAPKASMTIFEENDLRSAVRSMNSDLPRTIGTIGTMDSITYHNKTIIYNITVFGDNGIKKVYKQHYNEFEDILKYSLLSMNGQHGMADMFFSALDKKDLSLCFRVYTQDSDVTIWNMPGKKLREFAEACKVSPTTALRTTIEMQIEIANLQLPVKPEELHDSIRSVVLNAFLGDLDENLLPQAVSHEGEDIVFEYNVNEKVYDINELENIDNPQTLDFIVSTLIEDADFHEFLDLVALSHSNLVIKYEGRNSHKKVSISIPYSIVKKYCKVPQYLLS